MLRTSHTVTDFLGNPKVEQYFAPLDTRGPIGPGLDWVHLGTLARQRMTEAVCKGDVDRWHREQLTHVVMLRQALVLYYASLVHYTCA